ncbi:hypothetical protein [Paraurantiacibacter namhicola]|uniref:Lysozyme inhibitor LprI N-terminal domain-containing protein n=1 Tax=Paraurantiacibacter namhicola TaxID=645517 RepID=A0A1C7D984_9SPHN|nr:hypothetical protein [Paraurantiacibacter namhicola]ANU08008.1 hypothetical protein A6F65_01711 [Paraurantiacibacter namhicola]
MKTIIRNCALALGGMALATTALPVAAQDGDSEMKPEVYQLLVDCGAAHALASSGTKEEAEAADYEKKAVAFWQVAMVYGDADKDKMKDDGAASITKINGWVQADDDSQLEGLLTKCIQMEDVVMDIHSGK